MAKPLEPPPRLQTADVEIKAPPSFLAKLRAYFFTGLVITAPIAITIWATYWFVTFFDAWVKPFIPSVYNPDSYLPFELPGYGLVFALITITMIGALAANLVGRTLLGLWERAIHSTPFVRSIYKGSKQIFSTVFSQTGTTFRYVCLVEWPRRGVWAIAFVSREVDGGEVGLEPGRPMYSIYISTTPNPTGGYVFFADREDVKILDMTVEDGLKLIISMGLVLPERPMPRENEVAEAAPIKPPRRKTTRRKSA